jgi:hypothetical protein
MIRSLPLVVTLTALAAITALPARAFAQSSEHPFGLGLQLGDPTGFCGKYWLDEKNAIQATLGWTTSSAFVERHTGGVLTVDWTYRFAVITPHTPVVRFGFHAGAGGGLGWNDQGAALVARAPVGFAAYFPEVRLEPYVEIVLAIRLVPNPEPSVMGGVGGRYYF